MCGRFHVIIELTEFLQDWNNRHGIWLTPEAFEKKIEKGNIYPMDYCPVILVRDGKIDTQIMRWGLERQWSKTPWFFDRKDMSMERVTA